MKKKKVFQSKSLKIIVLWDRLVWLMTVALEILKETNGQFLAQNLEDVPLRKSDTYLIEGLVHHTFSMEDDNGWQELVKQEEMEDGYIALRTEGM